MPHLRDATMAQNTKQITFGRDKNIKSYENRRQIVKKSRNLKFSSNLLLLSFKHVRVSEAALRSGNGSTGYLGATSPQDSFLGLTNLINFVQNRSKNMNFVRKNVVDVNIPPFKFDAMKKVRARRGPSAFRRGPEPSR